MSENKKKVYALLFKHSAMIFETEEAAELVGNFMQRHRPTYASLVECEVLSRSDAIKFMSGVEEKESSND